MKYEIQYTNNTGASVARTLNFIAVWNRHTQRTDHAVYFRSYDQTVGYLWVILERLDITLGITRSRIRIGVIRLLDARPAQCMAFRAFRSALWKIPTDISYIQGRNALHSLVYYSVRINISKKSRVTDWRTVKI